MGVPQTASVEGSSLTGHALERKSVPVLKLPEIQTIIIVLSLSRLFQIYALKVTFFAFNVRFLLFVNIVIGLVLLRV